MAMKHHYIPPTATKADVFMLIVRIFALGVIRGFAVGKNTHAEYLQEALEMMTEHGIAPKHLVAVSNALVEVLHLANAEYDLINQADERVN